MPQKTLRFASLAIFLSAAGSQGAVIWQVGTNDNDHNGAENVTYYGTSGTTDFQQETATNSLPGATDTKDDDYYFAGVYSTVVDGGSYTPIGTVSTHENVFERAATTGDRRARIHFNLANTHDTATDLFRIGVDHNLNNTGANPGTEEYDMEIYFNGSLVGSYTHTTATRNVIHYSTEFALDSVGGTLGSGFDNYVEVRLVAERGGASWVTYDDIVLEQIPEPSALLLTLAAGLPLCFRRRRSSAGV